MTHDFVTVHIDGQIIPMALPEHGLNISRNPKTKNISITERKPRKAANKPREKQISNNELKKELEKLQIQIDKNTQDDVIAHMKINEVMGKTISVLGESLAYRSMGPARLPESDGIRLKWAGSTKVHDDDTLLEK
jgi:hypothetical protein